LERALDWLQQYGSEYAVCAVEEVGNCPCWNRGTHELKSSFSKDVKNNTFLFFFCIPGDWKEEYCKIEITPGALPHPHPLDRVIKVLANGLSVGTSTSGVRGDLLIVNSWEDLEHAGAANAVEGKIVLYDYKNFVDYSEHAGFRGRGANMAAQFGASAVLVRSMTPNDSTSSVHTGSQIAYSYSHPHIPAACISIEDTELISRLMARGHKLLAELHLPCYRLADRTSRNLVFEIRGTDKDHEIVMIGGDFT
jgi:hypothetical protein